jgi:hypothetical protein
MLNGGLGGPGLTTALALASGVVLTYLTAILKFRKDLEADFDKDLRERRLKVYEELWSLLELLARYDLPRPLTPGVLTVLTVSMRKWYFAKGGLYLSDSTRKVYFDLKDEIRLILADPRLDADRELSSDESHEILEQASLLRAWLTKDVKTRRSPAIPDA